MSKVKALEKKISVCEYLSELLLVGYDIQKNKLTQKQVNYLKDKFRAKQKELEDALGS